MTALRFVAGPWDNRIVDSEVVRAPQHVKPDPDEPGTYVRAEYDMDSDIATYMWTAEATDAP
jgi:hypothetical protein